MLLLLLLLALLLATLGCLPGLATYMPITPCSTAPTRPRCRTPLLLLRHRRTETRHHAHPLAERFLPLVLYLPHPKYCVMPLWACAKTQYGWAGDGEGDVPLAEALLRRLGDDGCALLQQANAQDHSNLWWALSEAPNPELVAAQGQLLAASAECLVGMRGKGVVPQVCSNVLLACARLQYKDARLVHHMTRCLVEFSDPDAQALANALYALGELREDCGHVPHPEDLDRLVGAVVQRLCGGLQEGQRRLRVNGAAAPVFSGQDLSITLYGMALLQPTSWALHRQHRMAANGQLGLHF